MTEPTDVERTVAEAAYATTVEVSAKDAVAKATVKVELQQLHLGAAKQAVVDAEASYASAQKSTYAANAAVKAALGQQAEDSSPAGSGAAHNANVRTS